MNGLPSYSALMKVIVIPECLDCPHILSVDPKIEPGDAYCKKYKRTILSLGQIPEWCDLEELDQDQDFEKDEGINWATAIAWLGVFVLIGFIVHTCAVNA